jgi:orotate phosphoribosyltransferase
MNTYDPTDNIVPLHTAARMDPDLTLQLALFAAGDAQQPAPTALALVPPPTEVTAPGQLRLFSDDQPTDTTDGALATRLATAPGLVQAGASRWDGGRTPIHPLSLESAYADPLLLRDLGARGARFARDLGVDVVVGAETAGVPLAAAVSLAGGLPFAFVRKPGYRGHEPDEPPVRGAQVAGRRVLLVDDAVSSGTAVERFTAALAGVGAEVVGVFVLVDMRDVADTVTSMAAALPTESVSTYLQVLELATANSLLDPAVHMLSVDAIVNRWSEDDPRWDLLPMAA